MPLTDRYYYLSNFERMLDGLRARDGDLLNAVELHFIRTFADLPQDARALLVRMLMRRGPLFRRSRLAYDEIPDLTAALLPMIELG